jgi:hypothetical protein
MREFDEVRRAFDRLQDRITSAISDAKDETFDIPDELSSELESLLNQAEYYAEDLVVTVDNHEEDFVQGGQVTVYSVPVTLTVQWDRDERAVVSAHVQDFTSGWSPDTVEDEEGNTIASDGNQCYAWADFLRGLPGTDVSV